MQNILSFLLFRWGKIIRTKSVLNDSLQSPKKSKGFQLTKYMFFNMLNNLLHSLLSKKTEGCLLLQKNYQKYYS